MRRVLVLEADDTLRREMLLGLRAHGIDAEAVPAVAAAAPTLDAGRVDAVLLGPTGGAMGDLLSAISASLSPARVIAVVTGGPAEGLNAIRRGAADFVIAGGGMDAVVLALRKMEAQGAYAASAARAPARTDARAPGGKGVGGAAGDEGGAGEASGATRPAPPPVLVGDSPRIAAVLTMVRRLAGVRAAVLIGGESGTGKELVAQALHDQSPWRHGPFVAVNCGAIPAGLIESELFGHVRGSFTDAVRDKRGLFEAAHDGTLFLDEIADLPLALQPKLLRAVQDGVMRKVGDVGDLRVEVRVVAATARDLAAETRAGRFREDLYYRLAGLTIFLPPLRDRPEDIPILARHFLARARARLGLPVNDIQPGVLRLLRAYAWPGNVRELENTIERAAVLSVGDSIDAASLPERLIPPGEQAASLAGGGDRGGNAAGGDPGEDALPVDPKDLSIKRASRRAEQELIRRALAVTGGNRTRAAALLEISHRALLYKIKEYGIVVERGRASSAEAD